MSRKENLLHEKQVLSKRAHLFGNSVVSSSRPQGGLGCLVGGREEAVFTDDNYGPAVIGHF